jgi:Xaa-Pro aminopeptidase
MFERSLHERRARLTTRIESGSSLGNDESPVNLHNAYPFRQDSTFLYYFDSISPVWQR